MYVSASCATLVYPKNRAIVRKRELGESQDLALQDNRLDLIIAPLCNFWIRQRERINLIRCQKITVFVPWGVHWKSLNCRTETKILDALNVISTCFSDIECSCHFITRFLITGARHVSH